MPSLLSEIDFGNEAGDDLNAEEIGTYFVEQGLFRRFLNPTDRIHLATAKKGVGKSALIRWIEKRVNDDIDPEALVISVTGSDLVRGNFHITTKPELPNDYIRDWMVRICALVNRRLGAEINFAASDDRITLVESSEIDGFKQKNFLTALTQRLTKLFPTVATVREKGSNEVELLKRFEGRRVWILVDDLDATYQRTDRENLELSTFFTACRYLSTQVSGLVFRVTMRTDVWPMIRRFDESLDKFEQYVSDITWSQADFRTLLSKRIQHQMTVLGQKDSNPPKHATAVEVEEHLIDKVFVKRMKWGENEKRTYSVIYTVSYHRPRWAIQLCKLSQSEARQDRAVLIAKEHIDAVWGVYGNKRIADLISEHKHQCIEIEELITAFRGAERRLTREQLLDWVKRHITNHLTPLIEGRRTNKPIDIAHFLYRIGFIVARTQEEDGREFEHYHFSEMPDFLSSRTNEDFGVVWEIHPCYREALDIQKLNIYQRKKRNMAR